MRPGMGGRHIVFTGTYHSGLRPSGRVRPESEPAEEPP